jgi:hypothetical protein
MKSSLSFFPVFLCATLGWSQTTTTTAPVTPAQTNSGPGSAGQLKVRGPEAVAQQDPNRVVATIGGKQITAKQALELLKPLPPQERKRFEANLQPVLQQLYMENQIADQASKMNLDQQSPWKEQLQLARANILTQAYVEKMSNGAGGAADPKQYYDTHSAEFDQAKVSGILVAFSPPGTPASNTSTARTEAQAEEKANDLERKIKSGADLATLARAESDNQQSAARGGELGTFLVSDPGIPADIKGAVAKLQPGQVSEPVRVSGGLYILKLDSRTHLPFEQVRAGITQKLQNEKSQSILNQERDKYKVQIQDPDFFNASSAPAPNIPSLQRPSSPGAPTTGPVKPPVR